MSFIQVPETPSAIWNVPETASNVAGSHVTMGKPFGVTQSFHNATKQWPTSWRKVSSGLAALTACQAPNKV